MIIFTSKKWPIIFFIIAFSTFYFTYPYVTLWSITAAVQTHNTQKFLSCMDWTLVKNNLRHDLIQAIMDNPATSQNELPQFGDSFAISAINNTIDASLTPHRLENLLVSFHTNKKKINTFQFKEIVEVLLKTQVTFKSPIKIRATFQSSQNEMNPPLQITMKLKKWSWKITSIQFSKQYVSLLLK